MIFAALDLPPLLPATHQTQPPAAMGLFEAACLNGQVALESSMARSVPFARLPAGARRVFRYALSPGADNSPRSSPLLGSSRAPSVIYRMSYSSETYLILPDELTGTAFSNVCAVITREDRFEEAKALVFGRDLVLRGSENSPGSLLPYVSTFRHGYRLSAALYNGWTLAATVPEQFPFESK